MTSYLNLTESDKQKVLELYYAMIPSKEIQKTLDISHRCYRSVLKEFNINGKLKNRYSINEFFFDNIDNDEKAYSRLHCS
jgi:5-bromo-4-chloroindolyl phosphate hydrolysis protein